MKDEGGRRKGGCARKIFYRSKTAARKAAKRERLRLRKPMYFYRCEVCGGWHLSSHRTRGGPRRFVVGDLEFEQWC